MKESLKRLTASQEVMIELTQACRHNPSHHAQRVQDSEAGHGMAESWVGVR